jgi:hypothetical protein
VSEQIGPSTSDLAIARKVQKQTCTDILEAMIEQSGKSVNECRSEIILVGLSTMSNLRRCAEQVLGASDQKLLDLMVNGCLAGFGWAGIAAYYDLETGYINMLDELNGLNVKDVNDLPPTEEKG